MLGVLRCITMSHSATTHGPRGHAHNPSPTRFHTSHFTAHAPLPTRLLVICLSSLLGLLTMGAGGPVLQGSQPGDLSIYPEQIAAMQAKGFNPQDDNEADALALLAWALVQEDAA